jgi:hypothetical protein
MMTVAKKPLHDAIGSLLRGLPQGQQAVRLEAGEGGA